ncbi:heterokaryon incompatibility protein [Macrophomina phaseolina MS6]|uniref:Heterokaryon incompatibility protein n=1 Tax=Macrophomina phaseolina (strain MS6) TaxID=1126212 RepID=K2RDA8_MACPH|nr:heterokaryon incompatibility protein [Macrophomina phaseolina MS6]
MPVKTLRSIVREMEEQTQGFEWSRMDAMNVDIIGAGALGSHQWPYPACVGEVVNLYERPWFSRLWVVQEVILSPVSTFVSGENEVDWPEVGKAATWLLYKAGGNGKCDVPPERRAGLWNASGMWKKFDVEHGMNAKNPAPQLERLSLCELVWNTLRFNVSEPKDRIFAVLGLTKWSATNMALPEAVRPDYSKNLYSVYRDAIKIEIAERKELGILEGGIVDQQSIFSCEKIQTPTWVHRWDKMETEEDPDQLAWWLFKASGEKTEISVSWFQIPQSLLVRGAKVDHIRMVSDTIRRSDFQSVEKQRDLLSSLWLYVKQGSKDCESESVFTFSLILVGGSVNRRRAEKYPNHSRNFAAYLDWLGLCPWIGTIHHPVKLDASGDPKEFEDAMVYALRNRRLFVTREGYIGIGSQLIQENDLVCVLQGANMPYILRPNEPYYHFLWTCYVPGVMDGETDAFRKMLFDIR